MIRYLKYTRGQKHDICLDDRYLINNAKYVFQNWFVDLTSWFGLNRRISSLEELIITMDLIGC